MKVDWSVTGPSGIGFFGKVTASISHELKNALAIVNENAGLLEDFVLMAEKGLDIDPDRLATIATRISGQIGRADMIVRNLNSFAHTVDQELCPVDINSNLELTCALVSRIVAMNAMAVSVQKSSQAIEISTSPFLLQHLVSAILFSIAMAVEQDAEIVLRPEQSDSGVVVRIECVSGQVEWGKLDFAAENQVVALLDALCASVSVKLEDSTVLLGLGQISRS